MWQSLSIIIAQVRYIKNAFYELFSRFIDQFLIINLLAQNRVFASCLRACLGGQGDLFYRPFWHRQINYSELIQNEVEREFLLNDDRCALRNYGHSWRVFGTPWYGESRVSSSNSAALTALFFIRHSKHNYIRRIQPAEILPQLMILGLLPLWDKDMTSAVIDTFQDIIRTVPAFEFGFVPGKAAINLIKETIK